jgi:hypothetical protein
MKKCPSCQKEFPDAMRFCQSDGTPLVEVGGEVQAEDLLKTTVVRQEDIASAVPPSDPFKTVVASQAEKREESGDLLQLPEEHDPLKTMVVTPNIQQDETILENVEPEVPKFEAIKGEMKAETPLRSPFDQFSTPFPPADSPIKSPFEKSAPQKFDEPGISLSGFSDSSAKEDLADSEGLPATVIQSPADVGNFPKPETPLPGNLAMSQSEPGESPFGKKDEPLFSSTFDTPKPVFEPPPLEEKAQTPFSVPPKPFEPPPSPFQSTPFEPSQKTGQEAPNPFGSTPFSQTSQENEPFSNQPFQQAEWVPPPPPMAGWQEQGVGANTPFQPPVAGSQSQTLAIVSLICGVISIIGGVGYIIPLVNFACAALNFLLGIGAIVTGFLARSRAVANPEQYGGAGLAMGGIIAGAIGFLTVIGWVVFIVISLIRYF